MNNFLNIRFKSEKSAAKQLTLKFKCHSLFCQAEFDQEEELERHLGGHE